MTRVRTELDTLDTLKRERPEWAGWLDVLQEPLRQSIGETWDDAVPSIEEHHDPGTPLLDNTTIAVHAPAVTRLWQRVVGSAAASSSRELATLGGMLTRDLDVIGLFSASLTQMSDATRDVSTTSGVDSDALQSVVALLAVPFLQACRRRWTAAIPESWLEGYCPVCAAWPALTEVRGIERTRFHRCARCGGAWHAHVLRCPYCAMTDHDELVTLVPDKAGRRAVVEACLQCRGYVKTFTTLQGCAPGAVMLEDLSSVDLDLAAIGQGFTRPQRPGYPLSVSVEPRAASRGVFAWKA